MAANTWYVRPDASHEANPLNRDGTTYARAWAGWTEIVWGASGVYGLNDDVLYICGAHTHSAINAMGAHLGTSAHRLIVRGDYAIAPGSITMSSSSFYFNINRSYSTLMNIAFNSGGGRCIGFLGAITGIKLLNVTLNGNSLTCVEFLATNGYNFTDITFDGCGFANGGGGGGSAIHWSPPVTNACFIAGMVVKNSTFTNCRSTRAVIDLHPLGLFGATGSSAPQLTTKMSDIDIHNNTFINCGAVTVEAYGPEIYGRNTGLKIYDNEIYNQTFTSGSVLGGGFALGGFVDSLTPDFGQNVIYNNKAYGLIGPTGFCNPMYGSYAIFYNYAEDVATTTIDGCGILFDHGSNYCVAFGNEFRRLTGTGSPDYISGAGIGVIWDANNITAFGNIVDECVIGILYGNQSPGMVTNIFNNTFLKCSLVGVSGNNTTYPTDPNLVTNNIFTSAGALNHIRYNTGTWTGETHNIFHGFPGGTQSIHATSVTTDPELDTNRRPTVAPTKRTGVYLGGKDFFGKEFYNPPNIGAVDDHPVAAWDAVTRRG